MLRTEVIERLETFGLFHVSIAHSAVIPEIQEFLVDLSRHFLSSSFTALKRSYIRVHDQLC